MCWQYQTVIIFTCWNLHICSTISLGSSAMLSVMFACLELVPSEGNLYHQVHWCWSVHDVSQFLLPPSLYFCFILVYSYMTHTSALPELFTHYLLTFLSSATYYTYRTFPDSRVPIPGTLTPARSPFSKLTALALFGSSQTPPAHLPSLPDTFLWLEN